MRGRAGAGAALLLLAAAALVSPQAVPSARPALAAIALSIKSRAVQDSRCYLAHGGAVESFYIAEDTPLGSVVGTLSVNGDASIGGDIALRLAEADAAGAALALAPGSKNLTLQRALDREQRAGPASLYVNVRCERRGTSDPSFVIPVSVRVWDVNDNSPAWHGAPYRARLSELTAVGARLPLELRASDADQPGPHATLHYSVLPGPHSEYFEFPNELESILVVAKPLDYESVRNMSLTLRAADAGQPPRSADATLVVEILDADDQNPVFSFPHYTAVLPENATEGTELETSPGPISAADQDAGIRAPLHYSLASAGAAAAGGPGGAMLALERDTGRARATAALLDALPATIVIKATQYDNPDRYALATLLVTRAGGGGGRGGAARGGGGGDAPAPLHFSRREYHVAVREDTPAGGLLATLHTSRDPAAQPPLQFYVSERSFLERFALNAAGELLLRAPLDYERQPSYLYRVMVTDGRANDTASLNISVVNVNEWEPRFRHAQYEFAAPAGAGGGAGGQGGLLRLGRLEVYDGDADTLALTLRGPNADMFYMNASGELFLKAEALQAVNTSVLHVLATATDSGDPPRQSSVPVLVHVPSALRAGAGGGAGGALLAGGGAALAALLLLLAAAALYTHKRVKSSAVSHSNKPAAGGGYGPREKGGGSPPRARSPAALGVAPSGSLLSVSAGASTILAASNSSLDLRGSLPPHTPAAAAASRQSSRMPSGKSRVAPLPPPDRPPGPAGGGGGGGGGPGGGGGGPALMSDHLGAGTRGRSGVAWPSATIPARVKKLSWDDADHKDQAGGELLQATNPALQDHLNLTVYF